MSAYVTKPISTCERVSRALSALLSELHFPTRALGPITEARDLLLRAALDANEFYSTERDELTRDVVKLRADLAAAVAKRNEWAGGAARLSSQLGNLLAVIHRDGGHYEAEHGTEKACADAELAVHVQRGIADGYHDALKIWRTRAEQAEARLAAIDAAPVVAWQDVHDPSDLYWRRPDPAQVDTRELIARPAKD